MNRLLIAWLTVARTGNWKGYMSGMEIERHRFKIAIQGVVFEIKRHRFIVALVRAQAFSNLGFKKKNLKIDFKINYFIYLIYSIIYIICNIQIC